jgi:hypothetical protein
LTVTRNPIAVFTEKCGTLADRVRRQELAFIEAVDMAYSAADFAGLIESYGDDQIQNVLAAAFMGSRPND